MSLKVYLVYDAKSESYGTPMFFDCRANALRALQEAVNETGNRENQLAKYPADFTFFEVGEYDRTTGMFEVFESKVNLGSLIEYKNAAVAA